MYKAGMNATIVASKMRREEAYKNKSRVKCKHKLCSGCGYRKICTEVEDEES